MREQLETTLSADWTYDSLAVYSDFLQSHGDPRGELIAIDLRLLGEPRAAALQKRRATILDNLLGDWSEVHPSWFKLGFVYPRLSSATPNAIQTIYDSPFAPYVRDVSIFGPATWIKRFFSSLAKGDNRWLRRITLESDDAYGSGTPIIGASAAKSLSKATPGLLQIEQLVNRGVHRRPMFERLDHPRAKHLETFKDTRRVVAITAEPATIDVPLGTLDSLGDAVGGLPEAARIGWTRLRIAIDNLLAREPHDVPVAWIEALLAHVDLSAPPWPAWRPLRDATVTTATLVRA